MNDLPSRLKTAIRSRHDSIELLPFTQRMSAGQLPIEEYRVLLVQLLRIHESLEGLLADWGDTTVAHADAARTKHLRADAAFLRADPAGPILDATDRLCETFQGYRANAPWKLLGAFYIFEGSRMGSRLLASRLAESFGVPMAMGHGLDYHIDRLSERPLLWNRFRQALSAAPFTPPQQDDIVSAAVETMSLVQELYESLSGVAA